MTTGDDRWWHDPPGDRPDPMAGRWERPPDPRPAGPQLAWVHYVHPRTSHGLHFAVWLLTCVPWVLAFLSLTTPDRWMFLTLFPALISWAPIWVMITFINKGRWIEQRTFATEHPPLQ